MINNEMRKISKGIIKDMKTKSSVKDMKKKGNVVDAQDIQAQQTQRIVLLKDVKELKKNIKKLSYTDSDKKEQMLKDIKDLNELVKESRVDEYKITALSGYSPNRFNMFAGHVVKVLVIVLLFFYLLVTLI